VGRRRKTEEFHFMRGGHILSSPIYYFHNPESISLRVSLPNTGALQGTHLFWRREYCDRLTKGIHKQLHRREFFLRITRMVKIIPQSYETIKFIIVFTTAGHLILS
jgi:hypothetical protein